MPTDYCCRSGLAVVRLRGEGDGERPGGRRRPHPVLPRSAAHRLLLLRRQGTE